MTIKLTISVEVNDYNNPKETTLIEHLKEVFKKAEEYELPAEVTFHREPTFVPQDIRENPFYKALLNRWKN